MKDTSRALIGILSEGSPGRCIGSCCGQSSRLLVIRCRPHEALNSTASDLSIEHAG